jgi:plastocyanin
VGNYEVGDTAYAVTFEASGTFGFECLTHSTMRGAVDVVP